MDGVIIVDKPGGKTSYAVVEEVKGILKARKVGHAGTLDPLATGVLVLCVDEATKISQFLASESKDYIAEMQLGTETDTLDIEGKIVSQSDFCADSEIIKYEMGRFVGKQAQEPPLFSALKYKGKPLYRLARKGIYVQRPAREIEIFKMELRNIDGPHVSFFVSCSKGTYIRSICAELGERLGTKACMSKLRRTRSGPFTENDAISLEELRNSGGEFLEQRMIPLTGALVNLRSIAVDNDLGRKLRAGYQPAAMDFIGNNIPSLAAGDMVKFINSDNNLLAIGRFLYGSGDLSGLKETERIIKIARVFNNTDETGPGQFSFRLENLQGG